MSTSVPRPSMLWPRWASPAPFRRWKPLSIAFRTWRSSNSQWMPPFGGSAAADGPGDGSEPSCGAIGRGAVRRGILQVLRILLPENRDHVRCEEEVFRGAANHRSHEQDQLRDVPRVFLERA